MFQPPSFRWESTLKINRDSDILLAKILRSKQTGELSEDIHSKVSTNFIFVSQLSVSRKKGSQISVQFQKITAEIPSLNQAQLYGNTGKR